MRELEDRIAAIPGVAAAEVTLFDGDEPPTARVWLDGTRTDVEVRQEVQELLGMEVPVGGPKVASMQRRGGLGRGLASIMPDVTNDPVPAHLLTRVEPRGERIQRVGVIESIDGVQVEIEDGAGNVHAAAVEPDSDLDDATLKAAAALSGVEIDVSFGTAEVEVDGTVVVVVVASTDDRQSAGACPVVFGRPFAVAKAARQALVALASTGSEEMNG